MHWYFDVLKKYATFDGRARRQEFWMFVLFNSIASILVAIVDAAAGMSGLLYLLYVLAVLLPALALAVRRLHDTGRSGLWMFLYFVPIAGPITLLVFFVLDGDPGPNAHGPSPKMVPAMA